MAWIDFTVDPRTMNSLVAAALLARAGRLGLLCAKVLHLHGLDVVVAGHHPERAALLPEAVAFEGDLLEGDAGARPFDLAVEATGKPEVLALVSKRTSDCESADACSIRRASKVCWGNGRKAA